MNYKIIKANISSEYQAHIDIMYIYRQIIRQIDRSVVVQSTRLHVLVFQTWCCRPRGFLESCWSSVYTGIQKSQILALVKECLRVDGVARKSEGKHGKSKSLLPACQFTRSASRKYLPDSQYVLPAQKIQSRKSLQVCLAAWV